MHVCNGQTSSFVVFGRGDGETGQAIYSLGVGFKQTGILILIFLLLLYPPPPKSYSTRPGGEERSQGLVNGLRATAPDMLCSASYDRPLEGAGAAES